MDFYQSFSGTDTLAFIMMPGCTPVVIGSLTTISYSMFRNKKPVINIGRTNINGVTRGSRIFAGTMIFTLINQHWLRDLQEQDAVSYLKDFKELKVDELPLFDIMIVSANEYGSAVAMYIFGIDFTDEAQTISVEDLFTENTFSFVARDISTFEKFNTLKNTSSHSSHNTSGDIYERHERIYRLASSQTAVEEIALYVKQQSQTRQEQMSKPQQLTLPRDLYLNTSRIMMGDDVMQVQTMLSKVYPDIDVNGMFDEQTDRYVKLFQSEHQLPIDGVVDDKVYAYLCTTDTTSEEHVKIGIVVNKNGSFSYRFPTINSNVNKTLQFKEKVELLDVFDDDRDGYTQRWYKTTFGYVIAEDVYSAYDQYPIVEFPVVKHQDAGVYVAMIQAALDKLYPGFPQTGIYDTNTLNKIKELQTQYGLYPSGIVDYETWLLLQSTGNIVRPSDDHFMFTYSVAPGVYTISTNKPLMEQLASYYGTINCNNTVTAKNTVIARYPNGNTKTFSIDKSDTTLNISVADLQKALVYNPTEGSMPTTLEWIVHPLNRTTYKWTFNIV